MFVPLSTLAMVSLGFKSLQNDFFYINRATIDTYKIEPKYLTPILMLKAMDSSAFRQNPEVELWLFECREEKQDLRGTGALRYIEAMADRSAAEKKQTGDSKTIREALEAQGGGIWYAPKARTTRHHIWLRKAINTVFSPYLFEEPVLVDQRVNSIAPLEGIEWKELAAVLTSSLFTYSLEINGSASMGAGALEAPTTKLRAYPVFDLTKLAPKERTKLVSLAEAVWCSESPIDWLSDSNFPGKKLATLDEWLLDRSGGAIGSEQLYSDIRDVCRSRIFVAKDKSKKTKKKKADSVGSVAESIAKAIITKIQTKNFPDDFADKSVLNIDFNFDRRSLRSITIEQLMDRYDVTIITKSGAIAYRENLPSLTAEALVRALLWGRSVFSISDNREAMEIAITDFIEWVGKAEKEISRMIAESALGTGYEDALRKEVFVRLGIHPAVGTKVLPAEIALTTADANTKIL